MLPRDVLKNFCGIVSMLIHGILFFFRQISPNSIQKNQWLPAEVPGSIHLDLMRNKMIPDPFYRDNEAKVQWVETVDWEYQTKFDVSKDLFLSRMIELRFGGLDTHAMVFLNERLILKANNFFRSWIVNVKNYIKEGIESQEAIEFLVKNAKIK